MPVFSRRRIQLMLDSLACLADEGKQNDLLARLNQKRTKDAIAAEMELGVLWAINEVANLEVEPASTITNARADAMSANLFGDRPAIIEITTLSDDFLGGEDAMRRVATKFSQFANSVVRRAEAHLYFTFEEESGYVNGKYTRRRLINPEYVMPDEHKRIVKRWLEGGTPPSPASIRIADQGLDVVIEWRNYVHPQFNFFCTMPPVTYSLTDNTLYKALKAKEKQLKGFSDDYLRCVFVADGGCSLIQDIGSMPMGQNEVRGEAIIEHFLEKSSVDIVCSLSPTRKTTVFDKTGEMSWALKSFGASLDFTRLKRIVDALPPPRLEGYQARSLHLQNAFDPQGQGWYLGSRLSSDKRELVVKISARALQELLAGKITYESFEAYTGFENVFRARLDHGEMISNTKFEPGGPDSDDDYVVFEFEKDAAAAALETKSD